MLINIDYLKLNCRVKTVIDTQFLQIKVQKYSSRQFAKIAFLYSFDQKIATMEYQPFSNILDPNMALIKIENHLLYTEQLGGIINHILEELGAEFISISRLDIALDFIKFKNNLTPKGLINGFMSGRYVRNGRGKFTVIGSQKNSMDVEYLRFGTKTSDINVYLYNKTKELEEVKTKLWITQYHKEIENPKNDDIWRLEVSLTSKAMKYIDTETGELLGIGINDILDTNIVRKIYYSLILKYFEFKHSGADKNKSRLKTVQLFDYQDIQYIRFRPITTKSVMRKHRMLAKSLVLIEKKYNFQNKIIESNAKKIVHELRKIDHLDRYIKEGEKYWHQEEH